MCFFCASSFVFSCTFSYIFPCDFLCAPSSSSPCTLLYSPPYILSCVFLCISFCVSLCASPFVPSLVSLFAPPHTSFFIPLCVPLLAPHSLPHLLLCPLPYSRPRPGSAQWIAFSIAGSTASFVCNFTYSKCEGNLFIEVSNACSCRFNAPRGRPQACAICGFSTNRRKSMALLWGEAVWSNLLNKC